MIIKKAYWKPVEKGQPNPLDGSMVYKGELLLYIDKFPESKGYTKLIRNKFDTLLFDDDINGLVYIGVFHNYVSHPIYGNNGRKEIFNVLNIQTGKMETLEGHADGVSGFTTLDGLDIRRACIVDDEHERGKFPNCDLFYGCHITKKLWDEITQTLEK